MEEVWPGGGRKLIENFYYSFYQLERSSVPYCLIGWDFRRAARSVDGGGYWGISLVSMRAWYCDEPLPKVDIMFFPLVSQNLAVGRVSGASSSGYGNSPAVDGGVKR